LDKPFEECCGRFLNGNASPETAEELMRSRFVAFGMGDFDYIERTQVDPLPQEVRDRKVPEWETLRILSTSHGGPEDQTGTVEFVAHYHHHGCHDHHEKSRFSRVHGEWKYVNGDMTEHGTVRRSHAKVGRNDPCPCGSGKKYKRCCGI
jgi:SEC-C motif-containing protein